MSGPVLTGQGHTLVSPNQIGFNSSNNTWPLEDLLSLSATEFNRIAIRSFESSGPSEDLDFVISVGSAMVMSPHGKDIALSEALIRLFERLDSVFGRDCSPDRLIIAPEEAWLDRLNEYFHLRQAADSAPYAQSVENSDPQACLNLIRQLGFSVAQHSPTGLLSAVSERWPWLDKGISAAPTLKEYCHHAKHTHLLITAFPEIFHVWKEVLSNGMGNGLSSKWEYRLSKNWFTIPRQFRELTLTDPASGASTSAVALMVGLSPLLRNLS
jgi:hypothetical protein